MSWSISDLIPSLDRLSGIAPTIAKLVGTAVPGGTLAIAGVRALMKGFGASSPEEVDVAGIVKKLDDPEIQTKLKEAERFLKQDLMAHEREMRALGLQEYQIQTGDLADVRRMITATSDRTPERLAYLTLAVFVIFALCILWMMAFNAMPKDQGLLLMLGSILGTLGTMAMQAQAVFTGAVPPSQPGKK